MNSESEYSGGHDIFAPKNDGGGGGGGGGDTHTDPKPSGLPRPGTGKKPAAGVR